MPPKKRIRPQSLSEEEASAEKGSGDRASSSTEKTHGDKRARVNAGSSLAPDPATFVARIAEAAETLPPDVQLVVGDGTRYPAHRLVLCASSPFFKKMFSSGMHEQVSGEVKLPDIDAPRLSAILAWMYGRRAAVDLASAEVVFPLLELAKRWEMAELCDQLSTCEACTLSEDNVLTIWELAQTHCLTKLDTRCRHFVMQLMAELLTRDPNLKSALPSCLRNLSVAMLNVLLSSNDLPIATEEAVLHITWLYIKEHSERLAPKDVDAILLNIRWPLVSGAVIAGEVMNDPIVKTPDGRDVRPTLLPAFARGMQFGHLGGRAWRIMKVKPSEFLRSGHRIPLRSYGDLEQGLTVRVLDDVEQLRTLCRRCAPGARMKVEWVADMKGMAGAVCEVKELRDEIAGARFEDPVDQAARFLPFDALFYAS